MHLSKFSIYSFKSSSAIENKGNILSDFSDIEKCIILSNIPSLSLTYNSIFDKY